MSLEEQSFEALFGAIGKKLDKIRMYEISIPEDTTPPIVEDPFSSIYIPEFKSPKLEGKNASIISYKLIGYITNEDKVKEPLYFVTFVDGKSRSYSQNKDSLLINRGKNIYTNPNTVIVDKSQDWVSNVIDVSTGNLGLNSSPMHANLNTK